MLKAGSDTRGTVQGLSHTDLDAGCTDEGISYELSIRSDRCEIDHTTYFQLLQYIRSHFPHAPMHAVISLAPTPQSRPLPAVALSFDYVILNGRRYTAATRLPTSVECFLATKFATDGHSMWWIGQLQHIYEIPHPSSHGQLLLAHVKWFKPAPAHAQAAAFWRDFRSLTVSLWCIDEPANEELEGPEIFIPLERIAHPAARSKVRIDGKDYWAAILLELFINLHARAIKKFTLQGFYPQYTSPSTASPFARFNPFKTSSAEPSAPPTPESVYIPYSEPVKPPSTLHAPALPDSQSGTAGAT
ncbi:hypothetical protein EV121DRAFT_292654 [Schizophyllum commune]